MLPHLNEREIAFVRVLAQKFDTGVPSLSAGPGFALEGVSLNGGELDALIRSMVGHGVLKDSSHDFGGDWIASITHVATQMVREFDEKKKREDQSGDVLEQLNKSVRSNKIFAGILFAWLIITSIAVFRCRRSHDHREMGIGEKLGG